MEEKIFEELGTNWSMSYWNIQRHHFDYYIWWHRCKSLNEILVDFVANRIDTHLHCLVFRTHDWITFPPIETDYDFKEYREDHSFLFVFGIDTLIEKPATANRKCNRFPTTYIVSFYASFSSVYMPIHENPKYGLVSHSSLDSRRRKK